jgi:hypothetical protein
MNRFAEGGQGGQRNEREFIAEPRQTARRGSSEKFPQHLRLPVGRGFMAGRRRERENRKDAAAVSSCSPLPCDTANDFLCEILNVTAAYIVVLFPMVSSCLPRAKKSITMGPTNNAIQIHCFISIDLQIKDDM